MAKQQNPTGPRPQSPPSNPNPPSRPTQSPPGRGAEEQKGVPRPPRR